MEGVSTVYMLGKTALSLAAIVALIYALSWFAKKYLKPQLWTRSGAPAELQIVHVLPLEARKKIMVIDVHKKRLVLGVTDQSIHTLCEMAVETSDSQEEKRHETIL